MKNYFGKKQLSKGLKVVIAFVAILAVLRCLSLWDTSEPVPAEFQRWSEDKANEWYAQQPWMSGCNFVPSNAINQLENPQKIVEARKTIARLMTVIREKEIQADKDSAQ